MKNYLISAHPYAFHVFAFPGDRWTGSGQVKIRSIGGGANQAWAVIEADKKGCEALTAAGFTVQPSKEERRSPDGSSPDARKVMSAKAGNR